MFKQITSALLLVLSSTIFISCSQNDNTLSKEPQSISGTLKSITKPQKITIGGKTIIFDTENTSSINEVQHDKIKEFSSNTQTEDRPLYLYMKDFEMKKIYSNQKITILQSKVPEFGYPTYTYFCDVYYFSKKVILPSNAAAARVFVPAKKPFTNFSNQDRGIKWTLISEDNSLAIFVSYYTLVVNYSITGQYVGEVIPFDGRTVEVPYQIYYQ